MVGSEEVPKHLGLLYYQMRKMEMELTCPTCSNLLRMPTMLPCNHIFCSSCIMTRDENQYKCPACLLIFHRKELRHSEHFEEIVNIFKSMETTMTGIQNLDSEVGISGVNTPSKKSLGLGCKHNGEMQGSQVDLPSIVMKVASNESHSCSGLSHAGGESQECQFGVSGKKVPQQLTSVPSNCTTENLQEAVSGSLSKGKSRYDDSTRSPLGGSQKKDAVDETRLKRVVEVMSLPLETRNVETQEAGITNDATNCIPSHPSEVDSIRGSKRLNLGSKLHSKPTNRPLDNSCKLLDDKTEPKDKIKANTSSSTQIDAISMRHCIPEEQCSELRMTGLGVCSDWLLCGSDLSTSEEELLVKFANLTGTSLTGRWRKNTTHVIVSTYKHAACRRTVKVLKAILNGKWVLSLDWIKACMKAGQPVPEEHYEISQVGIEAHTGFNGPTKGRLNAINKAPKIFHGVRFCFGDQFESLERGILEDLVLDAGGIVLRKDELTSLHAELSSSGSSYIVVNEDFSPEWSEVDRKKVLEKRSDEVVALKLISGFQVIGNASILDTIAACNSADELAKHVI